MSVDHPHPPGLSSPEAAFIGRNLPRWTVEGKWPQKPPLWYLTAFLRDLSSPHPQLSPSLLMVLQHCLKSWAHPPLKNTGVWLQVFQWEAKLSILLMLGGRMWG